MIFLQCAIFLISLALPYGECQNTCAGFSSGTACPKPTPSEGKADISTLKFVHAIWRHGDRTPSKMIPSDKVNVMEKWKAKFSGLGQLTPQGVGQHFKLGRLIRRRYSGFISKKFNSEEVVVRTSSYNRTQMSAKANLNGLFADEAKNNPPLPVEAAEPKELKFCWLPQGKDPLVFDEVDCPTATKAEDEVFSSPEFKKVEKENEPVLRFIGEHSGIGTVPHPLRKIYYIQDPLNSIFHHKVDGMVWPDWVNETMKSEIWRLYNLKNSFDFVKDVHKRLLSGPLFTEILQRMKSVISADYKGKEKFHAYSGHDLTIAGILSVFGIFPEVFPTYANSVLIELHQDKGGGEPFVRLFHKNETEGTKLWEYQIPNCGPPCTLKQLEITRKPFIISNDEWKKECGIKE